EMDNPGITIEEYVQLETENALRNNQVYNWETAKYREISWCFDTDGGYTSIIQFCELMLRRPRIIVINIDKSYDTPLGTSDDAWINYFPNDDNDAIQANQEWFDDHEPMEDDDDDDDDDIRDLDDYLISILDTTYLTSDSYLDYFSYMIQYGVSTTMDTVEVLNEGSVIIEQLAKEGEKNVFESINEELQESLLSLKNMMYHSRQILRISRLRRIQDHCLTLKNTLYPHQRIRRI
ncbi:hypothetical protein Tco_1094468, partial [Tanacetum coccineum]